MSPGMVQPLPHTGGPQARTLAEIPKEAGASCSEHSVISETTEPEQPPGSGSSRVSRGVTQESAASTTRLLNRPNLRRPSHVPHL